MNSPETPKVIPTEAKEAEQVKKNEEPETEGEPVAPPIDQAQIYKQRQQIELRSGVESFLRIKKSQVLENQEVVDATKEWAQGVGLSEENLNETLKYFELIEPSLIGFTEEKEKIDITCALAELIAEGILDSETLGALSTKIVRKGKSGTMDRVCDYNSWKSEITIYDELFEEVNDESQNIVHILKHEISH
jgi:hypothetical protein